MPLLSAFTPPGMLYCSEQPSYAKRIYDSMRSAQGNDDGAFREFGYQGAKLYAAAMMLARVQECYLRIKEQHSADTVTFFLEEKEREYKIVPDKSRTDEDRRKRIRTRLLAGVGSSQTDLVAGLTAVLGSDFVQLFSSREVIFADLIAAYSTDPPLYVNYQDPTIPRKWMQAQHNWGPDSGNLIALLVCGNAPVVGDIFVFGSHNETLTQKCTVTTVIPQGNNLYEMNFSGVTKAVEKNQGFTSSSYPVWATGRRRFLIEVSTQASFNNNLMSDVDNYMERSIRAVSNYQKASPPNQVGGFQLNGGSNPGRLGFTLLETP